MILDVDHASSDAHYHHCPNAPSQISLEMVTSIITTIITIMMEFKVVFINIITTIKVLNVLIIISNRYLEST